MSHLPKPVRGRDLYTWAVRAWEIIRSLTLEAGPGIELRRTPSGTIISVKRGSGGGGGTVRAACPFGEIISVTVEDEPRRAIRGGLLVCGDKNFMVEPQPLNLETDGKWFVQIKLQGAKANRDDDDTIFLPGMETVSDENVPEWDNKVWEEEGNFDDTVNPELSSGLGTAVIPLGVLTITDGKERFETLTCGNIRITQCGGILGNERTP